MGSSLHNRTYFTVKQSRTEHTVTHKSKLQTTIYEVKKQQEMKMRQTFSEEDMSEFIEIIVISTKVINQTEDGLQHWTEHEVLKRTARRATQRTSHRNNDGTSRYNIHQWHAAHIGTTRKQKHYLQIRVARTLTESFSTDS